MHSSRRFLAMRTLGLLSLSLLSLSPLAGCWSEVPPPTEYTWELPLGFPAPPIPEDNPMYVEKVELGRRLFYDTRMSGNQTYSCASCHLQSLAFTDGLAHAEGSTGEIHRRSAMSLVNVAYAPSLTWANPLVRTLEEQALLPMFGTEPVELGLADQEQALLERLSAELEYQQLFQVAYPEVEGEISVNTIVKSLAAFQRTLISGNSPYDRYVYQRETTALSDAAKRGLDLFFSEKLECYHCHGSFNLTDSVTVAGSAFTELPFHNNGLYNLDGEGAYPLRDQGLIELTGEEDDMGNFRAPSLRNVAVTAPYMHDGSLATLDDVLDHYAAGGRTLSEGPDAGIGSTNPYKSELLRGFTLSEQERADVLAFLNSLTDETFLTDPRFSDPFAVERTHAARSSATRTSVGFGPASKDAGARGKTP